MRQPLARFSHRIARWSISIYLFSAVAGCGIHIHDDGRFKVAQDAVGLVQDSTTGATAPYAAMETNLNDVTTERAKINATLNQLKSRTFGTELAGMTREDIQKDLGRIKARHDEANQLAEILIGAAAADVQASLIQQQNVGRIETAATQDVPSIQTALDKLNSRLGDLENVLSAYNKASDALQKLPSNLGPDEKSAISAFAAGEKGAGVLKDAASAAMTAIANAEASANFQAALQVRIQAGQRMATLQKSIVAEMQRHLEALQAQQADIHGRDTTFDKFIAQGNNEVSHDANWVDDSIAGFVHSRLIAYADENQKNATTRPGQSDEKLQPLKDRAEDAVKFVAGLGLLVLVEQPADQNSLDAMAAEMHLHSIRISQIYSAERMELVSETTDAVRIYHSGGITPEEITHVILEAAQVGALFDIASSHK
jgi:hypothetical protein